VGLKRQFRRVSKQLSYRRIFVIGVEGAVTEPAYFAIIRSLAVAVVKIECVSGKQSDPLHVLEKLKDKIKQCDLKKSDQAWLVVDKDHWEDKHLQKLHLWSKSDSRHGFALSNPMFEYWLLLHFEDGAKVKTAADCLRRLKNYRPDYEKEIHGSKITKDMIELAVKRAKKRDASSNHPWPKETGTTVYKLVEEILTTISE
jgi:hypothetical protein